MVSILIKNGHVIDYAQGINGKMDIGITDGIVNDCEYSISSSNYEKSIDASGKLVLPGLIDLHAHVAEYITPGLGINADRYCLERGTTTVVDAGSTGVLTFPAFREFVINRSMVKIYSFINSESLGMIEFPQEDSKERWPYLITRSHEEFYDFFTNPEKTIEAIKNNTKFIVGIKWAHHGPKSFQETVKLSRKAKSLIMVENHHMPESLSYLKRGDIITHIYHRYFNKMAGRIDGMTGEDGNIHPEFYKAYKEGIIFDLGHGSGSFSWDVAELALNEGMPPHVISTDLWRSNIAGPVYDLPTTMSKLLYLGMSLEDVIKATTFTPAKIIGMEKQIGTLKSGAIGGLVIMRKLERKIELVDSYGDKKKSDFVLVPEMVIYQNKIIKND